MFFLSPILSNDLKQELHTKDVVIEINQLVNPIYSLNKKNIEEKLKS